MAEIKQTGSLDLRSAKAAKDTAIENSDAINLTPWFSYGPLTIENTGKYWSSESNHYQVLDDGWGRFDKENTTSSDSYKDIAILPQDVFELGQEYTFLLEWRNTTATGSTVFYSGNDATHYQFIQNDENPGIRINSTTNSSGSDRRFITCTLSASDPNATRAIYWRARLNPNSSITGEFRLSVYKGRYYGGYKPYVDQSLINGYFNLNNEIDNVRSNATSFCPTSFDTKDPTKWYQVSWMVSDFTKLDDGWYHLETDNTAGSSAASRYIAPRNWDLIAPGETYTILFEIRNFSGPPNTATTSLGYIQEMAGAQFWGNSTIETIGRPNHTNKVTYFYANDISDDGTLTFRMFKTADSTHLGDTQQYNGMCFRYRLYAPAGYVTSYDFRISIYPGKYYGGYTPYLINSTYYKILEVEDNAAPKATAIKRTQRIYYRSNSSTKPTTPGNATANWVTQTSNNVNATWTTAHLPISDTHKYIYTCEQSETNAGVVSYTTVLLDDTITVIDGGNIITGSVTANAIAAGSITSDRLAVYDATIQKIRADAIDTNSINIGYSQITNPPSIPSTVAELSDSSDYATNNALIAESNKRKAVYGVCGTVSDWEPKTVDLANYELDVGKIFTVKFTENNNEASKIQLKVNSIGAKDVWVAGEVTSSTNQLLWAAGAEISFYYDGIGYVVANEPRTWYGACNIAAGTSAKTDTTAVTNCVVTKGTKVILSMTNANTATSPTLNIGSTGARNIYVGNDTLRPLVSNGLSWASGYTQEFIFDGAAWRMAISSYSKNYVTVTPDGIKIHMNNDPLNYQHQTASGTTFYVGGKKRSNISSDGLRVYVGDNEAELAKFTTNGAQIGESNKSHIELDYHSMTFIDKGNNTYFHLSDLRNENGIAEIKDHFLGDGTKTVFYLSYTATDANYTVSINYNYTGTIDKSVTAITFSIPPIYISEITVSYTSSSSDLKAFTFGSRSSTNIGDIGGYSVATGYNVAASGHYSHAEGYGTNAIGFASHAEGRYTYARKAYSHAEGYGCSADALYSHAEGEYTIASAGNQTVVGRYNDNLDKGLFVVGNGHGSGSGRSNAFSIAADGDIVSQRGSVLAIAKCYEASYDDGIGSNNTVYFKHPFPNNNYTWTAHDIDAFIFECTDGGGNITTTLVYGPFDNNDHHQFNVTSTGVDQSVGLVFRSATFEVWFTGSRYAFKRTANDGAYKYGRVRISNTNSITWTYVNEVAVTKIYALS